MSVLKMKFISIVGKKDYFDDFVFNYIIDSGIQLENALNFLENVKGLSHYAEENHYNDLIKRSHSLISSMGLAKEVSDDAVFAGANLASPANIREQLADLEEKYSAYTELRERTAEQLNHCSHTRKQLELLGNLDVDLESFFNFEFIKFRFGRIPKKSYKQLQLYVNDLEAIVTPVSQDPDYMWIIYFTPKIYGEKIDGVFSSLNFERTRISGELKGTPAEALKQLETRINSLQQQYEKSENDLKKFLEENRETAIRVYYSTVRLNRISEVRKFAAHTMESFYIIGWMPENELKALIEVFDSDDRVMLIEEDPDLKKTIKPPTELRNNRVFRPFETLVRMYGLPSYNEIDPTAFVAITYFIMFGMMFGDVGQGVVLLLGGLALMRLKVALGGVIVGAGISSTLFGFLYGSIFGFEDWIPPLWMSPMHNINTMLIVGVATGVVMITAAMVLNVINGVKSGNMARILLDRNGVAGFVFYWGIVLFALYFIKTQSFPFSPGVLILLLMAPIMAMFFKEPIENLLHRKKAVPHGKGMFFVQTFFEMFDTVLSFLSNTISFIRLSAFALNHAGLFMAVMILADMTEGFGSVAEIIIGNILIIALEGLIVGIQALRLEYYELFSRFFTGDGRPYRPLKNQYFT